MPTTDDDDDRRRRRQTTTGAAISTMTATTTTTTTTTDDARIAWANSMRLTVTRPDALNDDGSINQQFFKPKKVVFETASKKWTDVERAALYVGLETHGVGEWSTMKAHDKVLADWDTLTLRVKASRMMGTQSLGRYPKGWRANKATVDGEYAKHKRVGEATGCWKSGTLVEDDHGSAGKYMAEHGLADIPPSL